MIAVWSLRSRLSGRHYKSLLEGIQGFYTMIFTDSSYVQPFARETMLYWEHDAHWSLIILAHKFKEDVGFAHHNAHYFKQKVAYDCVYLFSIYLM